MTKPVRAAEVCKEIVEGAEKGGCRALFITVDAPQLGRRERDMRHKASAESRASAQAGAAAGGSF